MPEQTIPDAAVGWAVSWEERGIPCRRIFLSEDAALNFAAHGLPPLPAQVVELVIKEDEAIKPEPVAFLPIYTERHCKQKAAPGGCQLHNLHCGYPDCDRELVGQQPLYAASPPAADVSKLEAALVKIASYNLSTEIEIDIDQRGFITGYDACVRRAREALTAFRSKGGGK